MTDHFITDYIVIAVGILQCVSVGWVFERETTACQSAAHRKSLVAMATFYWVPCICICFYANFVFPEDKFAGLFAILGTTIIALIISYKVSAMPF